MTDRHAARILVISRRFLSRYLEFDRFFSASSEGSPRLDEAYRSVIHSVC